MLQLIIGGVLALPPMLWFIVTSPIVIVLSLPAVLWLRYSLPNNKSNKNNNKKASLPKVAFITGGSQGLGLGVAKECVRRGDFARVVILARDSTKLQMAQQELEQLQKQQTNTTTTTTKIEAVVVDISDHVAVEQVAKQLHSCYNNDTTTTATTTSDHHATYLFQCAGFATPGNFLEIPITEFERHVRVNQLGSLYTIRAFLPYISSGTICLTSSMAGLFGVYGYTAYAPTKFALRGLAEVLHQELAHRPIAVQVAYPPDMDTPGFAEENKTKPKECRYISEQGGLSHPDDIGKQLVKEALQPYPKFAVYFNVDGWVATNMTAGMSPMTHLVDAMTQMAFAAVLRLIGLFYLNDWWAMVRRFDKEEKQQQQQTTTKTAAATGNLGGSVTTTNDYGSCASSLSSSIQDKKEN